MRCGLLRLFHTVFLMSTPILLWKYCVLIYLINIIVIRSCRTRYNHNTYIIGVTWSGRWCVRDDLDLENLRVKTLLRIFMSTFSNQTSISSSSIILKVARTNYRLGFEQLRKQNLFWTNGFNCWSPDGKIIRYRSEFVLFWIL